MSVLAVMMVTTEQAMTDDEIATLAQHYSTAFEEEFEGEEVKGDSPSGHPPFIWRVASWNDLPQDQREAFYLLWTGRYYDPDYIPPETIAKTYLKVDIIGCCYGGWDGTRLAAHMAIAAWLEYALPGCKVWYGGDTYTSLIHFDEAERKKAWEHFCKVSLMV